MPPRNFERLEHASAILLAVRSYMERNDTLKAIEMGQRKRGKESYKRVTPLLHRLA